jgi:outer membrane protein OmpA-like peptidoglycan-associated protein
LGHYQDLVARQDALALEKSDLQRKYDLLNQQVEKLKAYVLEQQRAKGSQAGEEGKGQPQPEAGRPLASPHRAPPLPPSKTSAKAASDRVVFRVNHDVGHTEFLPPEHLRAALLKAAKAAAHITIRGRTDATTADDVDTRIAWGRAAHARAFLVENGVDAKKIQVRFLAAGGFIADDSTPAGRALNRRVEIEMVGVDLGAVSLEPAQAEMGSSL